MRAAVVTGAGSGIGLATAEHLIERGWHVFGSVRSGGAADALSARFGAARFTPLVFDLRDGGAIGKAAGTVAGALGPGRLAGLVNNAGIAHFGPLALQPIDDWAAQIDVNLCGTLRVVQAFLPLLGSDPGRTGAPGRIVNISSVSGRLTLPFMSGYAASKHGLEALSDAMRSELAIYGIRTVVIQPGPVKTPIWEKLDRREDAAFRGSDFERLFDGFKSAFSNAGLDADPPERFAETIHRALTVARPRARYAIVRRRFPHWTLPRMLGDRARDALLVRQFGLARRSEPRDTDR